MSEYTPETEAVIQQYTREEPPALTTVQERRDQFIRWCVEEMRKAQVGAWGEGFSAGMRADHNSDWWPNNPYAEEATT